MKKSLIKASFAALLMLGAYNATAQNGMPSKNNVMNLKSAYVDKINEVKIEKNGMVIQKTTFLPLKNRSQPMKF